LAAIAADLGPISLPGTGSIISRSLSARKTFFVEFSERIQNPASSDELKAAVIDLIDRGLPQTLQDLQLIDQAKP
jgi:hypothetical protein